MAGYTPHTEEDLSRIRDAAGDFESLLGPIDPKIRVKGGLDLPKGKSELEVLRQMDALAGENIRFETVFRGAGAYRHFIPSAVTQIASREEFVTAYTPYQAEMSQGVLQAIFEYQSLICALTGMDASNASVYDGATAAAEAAIMTLERARNSIVALDTMHPNTLEVLKTYLGSRGAELAVLPPDRVAEALDGHTAGLILQQPDFYGRIADAEAFADLAHGCGAKFIISQNPISMALLKPPGECGADIAVGEGQPLGLPLSYGGPYLGFMACKEALVRRLPGRVVGQTADREGRRAFVLTLQTREQHIRREKASSSICSNQALCALTAAAYICAMGPQGLKDVARQCAAKAHYAAKQISGVKGYALDGDAPFFHEFVILCPVGTEGILKRLESRGVLGGLPLDGRRMLWCVTEMNTKDEIDALCVWLREAAENG